MKTTTVKNKKNLSKRIIFCALFVTLTVIGGKITIPMPGTVQLTFQCMFVVMSGLILGPNLGALCQLVYLIMGLTGLPVFSRGGGISYALFPSFGYIIGFVFGAFISGLIIERIGQKQGSYMTSIIKVFFTGVAGLFAINVIGMTYQVLMYHYYMGLAWNASFLTLISGIFYFIKDAILIALICTVYPRLMKIDGVRNLRPLQRPKRDALGIDKAETLQAVENTDTSSGKTNNHD